MTNGELIQKNGLQSMATCAHNVCVCSYEWEQDYHSKLALEIMSKLNNNCKHYESL